MWLTLHHRYQRLKTEQRRNQRLKKSSGGTNKGGTSTTWTGSSGVRPDARQPYGSRSLSTEQIANQTENGNYSSRSMPPKRTVCYQQREWQQTHFLWKTLPCTVWGNGNRTAMALLLANDEEAILSKLLVVRWSIGNAERVGQPYVGQHEELRNEDQTTRVNPIAPWCEHHIRAMEGGSTHWSCPWTGNRDRSDLLEKVFASDNKHFHDTRHDEPGIDTTCHISFTLFWTPVIFGTPDCDLWQAR